MLRDDVPQHFLLCFALRSARFRNKCKFTVSMQPAFSRSEFNWCSSLRALDPIPQLLPATARNLHPPTLWQVALWPVY
jgi:hypothetical protein